VWSSKTTAGSEQCVSSSKQYKCFFSRHHIQMGDCDLSCSKTVKNACA